MGSASATLPGKYLLVGPQWHGEKPEGFVEVLRSPTNYGGVFARSFAARTPESKARARAVLNQMGAFPLSEDKPGRRSFDCEASARNHVYPPGLTAQMIAADPDILRARPVDAATFWEVLEKALDANAEVGPDDAAMAAQARNLIALRKTSDAWRALLDREVLAADADLHESARYHEVGVDAGNGWQRQENGGAWGSDWFGRAQAAVIYIYVNDYHEAIYFVRATDSKGAMLHGRYRYTVTFPKGALPPIERSRGGFWSLTMYDKDYYILANPPEGRTNLGTVYLDADELHFDADGSLTLHLSHEPPSGKDALANWLPAPDDQFALIVRAYVPGQPLLDGSYRLPDVQRS